MYSNKLLSQLIHSYSQCGLIVGSLVSPDVLCIGLRCDFDGLESTDRQKAWPGIAKDVPCTKQGIRFIKGYRTSDRNADHDEGFKKMDKESDVR